MVSKKSLFLSLLILVPFCLTAYETVLKDRYLETRSDLIRWETRGDQESELKVTRYRDRREVWSYTAADISVYLNNHEFPLSAYALHGDVVTFPVTTEEAETGALKRRQIGLDAETGQLLWEKELLCGITQSYFYSCSDGERLYIHNLHEYKGSQLVCLDLKSGEPLWETEGLPQPALPVETEHSLILHSGLLREFMVIDKTDGTTRRHETSSPVQIWRGCPLFLRKSGEICRVIGLTGDGEEEILFELPDNDGNSIFSYEKDPFGPFFQVLHKPIIPWTIFEDTLILQRRTGEDLSVLAAYSLSGQHRILWEIPLSRERYFQLEADFTNSSMYVNTGTSAVLLGAPESAGFYQTRGRYLPLFVRDRLHSHTGLAVIDLKEGRRVVMPEELDDMNPYIFQTILRSREEYFYFLQRYSENNTGPSLVLRLNGHTGKITGVHRFENNIPDEQKWRKNPYLFLYDHSMDLLKWESISEKLKGQLMGNPGLPEELFE